MSIEAMKLALEYLQENEGCIADVSSSQYVKEYYEFMERFAGVIKQAEQQEPVAWRDMAYANLGAVRGKMPPEQVTAVQDWLEKVYTAPPKHWVGLTGDEVNEFAAGCHLGNSVQGAIRKAEAKLKEKNT